MSINLILLHPSLSSKNFIFNMESKGLELFEVGLCEDGYQMGFLIGKRVGNMIKSRLATNLILQNQLLPFVQTPQGQQLITQLSENNKTMFPRYWDELLRTAAGSGVSVLDVILINFRKEILPFLPKTVSTTPYYDVDAPDDCSDVLVISDRQPRYCYSQ